MARALGSLTMTAAGVLTIRGAVTKTLAALTSSAAGKLAIKGQASPTLGALLSGAAGQGSGASVPNQTATFGTLTIAGAGTFKPIGSDGIPVTLTTYNSLVSGSLGAYAPSILSGGVRFTGAAGAPAGAVLRCSHAGGTVDITIATVANTYSAATEGEITGALSAIGSAGAKTILVRRGSYTRTSIWAEFVNFAAEMIIKGEGTAVSGVGTTTLTNPYWFKGQNNMTIQNWEVAAGASTAFDYVSNAPSNCKILDCYIHGTAIDPQVEHVTYSLAPRAIGLDSNGLTVERCRIEYFSYGIQVNMFGPHYFRDNQILYCMDDCIQVGYDPSALTTAKVFERNVLGFPLFDGVAHNDMIQLTALGVGQNDEYSGLVIRQNVMMNSGAFSLGRSQGISSFLDGTPYGRRWLNPLVCGNVFSGLHLNSISLYHLNGGTFCNNTIANFDLTGPPATPVALNLGNGRSAGTILIKHNVSEAFSLTGGATYTQTENVTMGTAGATIAYGTVFDDAAPTTSITSYDNLKTKRNAKTGGPAQTVNAGALGSGYGVYGAPMTPGGWSYNAAYEA